MYSWAGPVHIKVFFPSEGVKKWKKFCYNFDKFSLLERYSVNRVSVAFCEDDLIKVADLLSIRKKLRSDNLIFLQWSSKLWHAFFALLNGQSRMMVWGKNKKKKIGGILLTLYKINTCFEIVLIFFLITYM